MEEAPTLHAPLLLVESLEEEAVEALGAALRGESEPIRKYGVLLDDDRGDPELFDRLDKGS